MREGSGLRVAAVAYALAGLAALALAGRGLGRDECPRGRRLVRRRPSGFRARCSSASTRGSTGVTRREVVQDESASTLRCSEPAWLVLVRTAAGQSVPEAVEAFKADPEVAYAEPNYLYHADCHARTTRSYPQLWGLARISAPAAWNITTGSAAVKVAVVDTGIARDHLDLAANVVAGLRLRPGRHRPA